MPVDDIAKILAGLGLGAGTGAVFTAIVNSYASKGKSRAEAADILVGAAERVGKMNEELYNELRDTKSKVDRIHLSMIRYLAEEITREELLNEMKEFRK